MRRSIYWKVFFTIVASILISSSAVGIIFWLAGPRIEVHPEIERAFIQKTKRMADQIMLRLKNSSIPIEDIIKEIHEKEDESIGVFDAQGYELVTFKHDKLRLKKKKRIPSSILEETLRTGENFQPTYPWFQWVFVASVPLIKDREPIGILQGYYTYIKGAKRVLPFFGSQIYMAVIIVAGIAVIFSRFLTRPIQDLTRAAQEMSKGHFGIKVMVKSNDETGRLGEAFNEMSQRLADLHKSRKELFDDITHEICSPLARIQTDAEILMDGEIEKREGEHHLKAICEEVKDINQLVEDLSVLSRLEYDQLKFEVVPSSLPEVLFRETSKLQLQLEEKGVELKQAIPQDIPLVMMDGKRIGQVISNLLMNSLRYTPRGGTIEIGCGKENTVVGVWVKDTGSGIPKEGLPYIFERFYRVDKSRSRTSGGRGLGLAIAKHLVKAHGGEIRAESEIGEGTCITFTLPLAL